MCMEESVNNDEALSFLFWVRHSCLSCLTWGKEDLWSSLPRSDSLPCSWSYFFLELICLLGLVWDLTIPLWECCFSLPLNEESAQNHLTRFTLVGRDLGLHRLHQVLGRISICCAAVCTSQVMENVHLDVVSELLTYNLFTWDLRGRPRMFE